jgi:hypothetical protein
MRGFNPFARFNLRGDGRFAAMSKGDIKESDWKVFKPLRVLALERFSERVLDEIARISSDNGKSKHERYVAIYRLVRERDKDIASIFDFQRRSTALRQVVAFLSEGLMTDEELRGFSPEFVKTVEHIRDLNNRAMDFVDEDDSAPGAP